MTLASIFVSAIHGDCLEECSKEVYLDLLFHQLYHQLAKILLNKKNATCCHSQETNIHESTTTRYLHIQIEAKNKYFE